jgi:hypothetical protein
LALVLWSGGAALAQGFETREFAGGARWFVFDGEVPSAIYVPPSARPQCHELGEIVLAFADRDQLLDESVVEMTALAGMEAYQGLCRSLGGRASSARRVIGFLPSEARPDDQGRIATEDQVLTGNVTALGAAAGTYRFMPRRNRVVDAVRNAERDRQAAAHQAEREREAAEREEERRRSQEEREAEIAALRKDLDQHLAESLSLAEPAGLFGRLTGGDAASLTGVWSASQADCAKEMAIFFDRDGRGVVEWWRSHDTYGFLPWLSGRWELRQDMLVLALERKVEWSFLSGEIEDDAINETVQLKLAGVSGDDLRLATPGERAPGLVLLGAPEKLFVRCAN